MADNSPYFALASQMPWKRALRGAQMAGLKVEAGRRAGEVATMARPGRKIALAALFSSENETSRAQQALAAGAKRRAARRSCVVDRERQ